MPTRNLPRRRKIAAACCENLESRTLFSGVSVLPSTPAPDAVDLIDMVALQTHSAIEPGMSAKIAVTVTNDGTLAANGPLAVNVIYSDLSGPTPLTTEHVTLDNLAIGRSKVFDFLIPLADGTSPGDYDFIATVDPGNTFDESNPDNNTAVTATTLDVLDPFPDIEGTLDGTFTVTFGPHKGVKGTTSIVVATESDTNGAITGTATSNLGIDTSFIGTTTTKGLVTMNLTDLNDPGTGTIVGKFNKGRFTGIFTASNGDISKVTLLEAP